MPRRAYQTARIRNEVPRGVVHVVEVPMETEQQLANFSAACVDAADVADLRHRAHQIRRMIDRRE
jgi:hypothetical protein